ncbi:MAG: TIGR03086 family protein, partial [Acidimicrobiales bacterium]
ETIDRFYTLDLIVHRWDIAAALGLSKHETLEEAEMAAIQSALENVPEDVLRSPGLFGPAVSVPPDAPRQAKVLAFTGRCR